MEFIECLTEHVSIQSFLAKYKRDLSIISPRSCL